MKLPLFLLFLPLLLAIPLFAQAPAASAGPAALSPKDAGSLETRMLQLVESTAVAVPGLVRASEPVKQNAEMTFSAIERSPQNAALLYQFINQVKAYLALSDSIPRPYPFPETADRQFAELRDDLARIQQHFEAILQVKQLAAAPGETDPDNLRKFADADSKLPPPGKLPRVVFLGDSITENWRLNEYFTGRDFINRGIGGQTTSQMLGRFLQDVVALHPRAVVIMGGINDIGRGIAEASIEQNLEMMGDLAKQNGIRPLFSSILPVSDYHKAADPRFEMTRDHPPALISRVNQWLQNYCARERFVYVNYVPPMVDAKGQMQADLADDGLHPNGKGYRVMSPVALEAIGRSLGGASPEDSDQAKRRIRLFGNK